MFEASFMRMCTQFHCSIVLPIDTKCSINDDILTYSISSQHHFGNMSRQVKTRIFYRLVATKRTLVESRPPGLKV